VTQDTVWHMPPNKERSLMLAKRQLSELVYDAVNLEGIPFTLTEIQTLLDGITVGGHKVADQEIALNQANAWRTLFRWVEQEDFSISAQKACELHAIAGKNEALAWGKFRTGLLLLPEPIICRRDPRIFRNYLNLSSMKYQKLLTFMTEPSMFFSPWREANSFMMSTNAWDG